MITNSIVHTHGILPSKEDGEGGRGGGGQFYWALGDLKFSLTTGMGEGGGGLSQMRGLKFSTLLRWDDRVFSTWGMEGVPPPLDSTFLLKISLSE